MIRSRLTTKSQTTIPRAVREALNLQPGDEVVYQVEGERVVLRKAETPAVDDPFATFTEWDGDADREAYADL
jgi:antitoxin PrlF